MTTEQKETETETGGSGSRIVVKQLPHYITLQRLKQLFFSFKGEITDVKLLQTKNGKSRRTAYVGYRTEEEAKEAIRYFNDNYIGGTAKIQCQVAREPGDPNIPRSWSRYSKEKKLTRVMSRFKTKTDNRRSGSKIDDPKLREFLQVMQPRSKSKLWADDVVAPVSVSDPICKVSMKHTQGVKAQRSATKEEWMHDEKPADSQNVVRDDSFTDIDYFRSRVRQWSDHDTDTDQTLVKDRLNDESTKSENPQFRAMDGNTILQTDRLYVHNLYYGATEDDLSELFKKYGNVKEVHLVVDKETNRSKGYGFVTYSSPEEASRAVKELNNHIFQGRMLNIEPAESKNALPNSKTYVSEGKSKTFKLQKVENRKASEASGDTRAWNSLFMRADTIVENITRKYGVDKSEFLDGEADDLAVRVALGETEIIAETYKALANAGVNVVSLEDGVSRKSEGGLSNHILLVKNLPFSSCEAELFKIFGKFGRLEKIIFPPTRTLALVIFLEPNEARAAFDHLRYHRYKDSVFYLEWAPSNILCQNPAPNNDSNTNMFGRQQGAEKISNKHLEGIFSADNMEQDGAETQTLYIENLNIKTTDKTLEKHIRETMKDGKILSVKIIKCSKEGKHAPVCYGFVEFDSDVTANRVLKDLQGTVLDKNALSLQRCLPNKDKAGPKKAGNGQSSTKLLVKNVAFEATRKDLLQLFSPFGQVKSLRLPKRFGHHRGFAFVEYATKQEAQNALRELSKSHLYGRHLILQRANEDESLEELRARTAAEFSKSGDTAEQPLNVSKKRKISGLLN